MLRHSVGGGGGGQETHEASSYPQLKQSRFSPSVSLCLLLLNNPGLEESS